MNRALQALAEEGLVERKRKGGTRVRPLPLPQASLRIQLLREQVEEAGSTYRCEIIERKLASPPPAASSASTSTGERREKTIEPFRIN